MPSALFARFGVVPLACTLVLLSASAQSQTDSARCRAVLNSPTHDSAAVRIGLSITSYDTGTVISAEFRALFAQAMRQQLKLPRPLPVDVYGFFTPRNAQGGVIGSSTVVPTVAGDYRAALKRDGHLANIRVVGGARTRAFDDAIMAALRAVSDSQTAIPLPEDMKSADSIEMKISIRIADGMRPVQSVGTPPPPPADPLFVMRVPAFGFPSGVVKVVPGNPAPLFPHDARSANVEGKVIAEFIVNDVGTVDMGSVQFIQATALPFASAVLDVLPQHRFTPLKLDGCGVASLVQMPFEFHLAR